MTNISLERGGQFIDQVAEGFPGGKLSCALTTQLNANVALGLIDSVTAAELQDELCHNPLFDAHWSQGCDSSKNPGGRAWMPRPGLTQRIVQRALDIELSDNFFGIFPGGDHASAHQELSDELRRGAVAFVSGRSVVASHARLIFEPEELPGRLYVHDPNYVDTTSLYTYQDLATFFRSGAWVFSMEN